MVNIHINEKDSSVHGVLRGLFIQNFINQECETNGSPSKGVTGTREPCYIVNAIHTRSDADALLTVDYNWVSKASAAYKRVENLVRECVCFVYASLFLYFFFFLYVRQFSLLR
jgi:hypothetical protein